MAIIEVIREYIKLSNIATEENLSYLEYLSDIFDGSTNHYEIECDLYLSEAVRDLINKLHLSNPKNTISYSHKPMLNDHEQALVEAEKKIEELSSNNEAYSNEIFKLNEYIKNNTLNHDQEAAEGVANNSEKIIWYDLHEISPEEKLLDFWDEDTMAIDNILVKYLNENKIRFVYKITNRIYDALECNWRWTDEALNYIVREQKIKIYWTVIDGRTIPESESE